MAARATPVPADVQEQIRQAIAEESRFLHKYGTGLTEEAKAMYLEQERRYKLSIEEAPKRKAQRIAEDERIRQENHRVGCDLVKSGTLRIHNDKWDLVTDLIPGTLAVPCKQCGKPIGLPIGDYADVVRGTAGNKSRLFEVLTSKTTPTSAAAGRPLWNYLDVCTCGMPNSFFIQFVI